MAATNTALHPTLQTSEVEKKNLTEIMECGGDGDGTLY